MNNPYDILQHWSMVQTPQGSLAPNTQWILNENLRNEHRREFNALGGPLAAGYLQGLGT
jgi:hypothetical protein